MRARLAVLVACFPAVLPACQTAGLTVSARATAGGISVVDQRPPSVAAGAYGQASASVTIQFFGIPLAGAQDVVFVLDRSGSMAGVSTGFAGQSVGMSQTESVLAGLGGTIANAAAGSPLPDKLDAAKAELARTLATMPDGTRVGIVFFDDEVAALSPGLMTLGPATRGEIAAFLARIQPGGSTAAVPAVEAALTAGAARVVLLSDGLANTGGGADELLALAHAGIARGVRFDTVGLGLDQDATLLRRIALASGGVAVQH